MHNILRLKGAFISQKAKKNFPSFRSLPTHQTVSATHLLKLANQLSKIHEYWEKHPIIEGAIISVHYRQVIAKSNRIQQLLKDGKILPNQSIRGAKFGRDNQGTIQNHIFTHFVSQKALTKSAADLRTVAAILSQSFKGVITAEILTDIKRKGFPCPTMSKSKFINIIVDSYYVEYFALDFFKKSSNQNNIVTIYRTGITTEKLLAQYGITITADKMIDDYTLLLNPEQINTLIEKAPYLISMSVVDMNDIPPETFPPDELVQSISIPFPNPQNEPIVGVIDTQFNENIYFHDWVEYKNMLDNSIPLNEQDYIHGTEVTSIIVDGPRGNPDLEDHCGHFRVKHFGVSTANQFSSFQILRLIRKIVAANTEIKVWNLSLGSAQESNANFISPEAAELDRIQSDYDVIFVVAGTNKVPDDKTEKRIGAPADSLNAIVVNSVTKQNNPASYTRIGPVLSFFHKPDFSYYGGDGYTISEKIAVCHDNLGAFYKCGTSFAAPWITRKLAYLIYIMGFSKEAAKALLVDAAVKWNPDKEISNKIGYGIIPVDINEILKTKDDEIRFVITGSTSEYETYNYSLPIPKKNETYPFFARATLAYFPRCNREQGVDYTGTELDIHFGRVEEKNGKTVIHDIKGNEQANPGTHAIYEREAREQYRKWDNIKHISDTIKKKSRARKAYANSLWGIRLVTKERTYVKERTPLPFGLVVTLKEMNGQNRYDDFIKLCQAYGWIINQVDVDTHVKIYEQSEEDIHLT